MSWADANLEALKAAPVLPTISRDTGTSLLRNKTKFRRLYAAANLTATFQVYV